MEIGSVFIIIQNPSKSLKIHIKYVCFEIKRIINYFGCDILLEIGNKISGIVDGLEITFH